jgi:hypothetical protein
VIVLLNNLQKNFIPIQYVQSSPVEEWRSLFVAIVWRRKCDHQLNPGKFLVLYVIAHFRFMLL